MQSNLYPQAVSLGLHETKPAQSRLISSPRGGLPFGKADTLERRYRNAFAYVRVAATSVVRRFYLQRTLIALGATPFLPQPQD